MNWHCLCILFSATIEKRARVELEGYLAEDATARGVLKCLSEGIVKRRDIAAALGVEARAVTAARKRLERRARHIRWRANGSKEGV